VPLVSRIGIAIAGDFGDSGGVGTPDPLAVGDCVETFEAHFDFVRRSLRRQGVAPCDLDDLMQEVFIALWRSWSGFDRTRPARAWLWGIVFRVARTHLRRRWREVPAEQIELVDEARPAEASLDSARARDLVVRVLARLPEKYRTFLVLHELDGIPVNELAVQLDLPLATAYTRARRARLAFAQAVGALREAGAPVPDALLALEREAPPAPARTRALVMQRVRAVAAAPPPLHIAPRWPIAAALAASVLTAIALPSWLARRQPTPVPSAPAAATAIRDRAGVATLDRDLVGHWTFDEGPALGHVIDRSGNGRNCLLRDREHAAEWVAGRHGAALDFAGKAWLECPQPDLPTAEPHAITVAVWVKVRTFPDLHAALATRQIGSGYEDAFFFGLEGNRLRVTSHAWVVLIVDGPALEPGRWYHTAFTHDQKGQTRVYLDGAEVGWANGGHVDKGLVTSNLTLGAGQYSRYPRQVRQRLDGALDDVRVYSRALSAAEIAALAEARGPVPVHLIATTCRGAGCPAPSP
jgi:RNA polymerase sigma-70 factor (ECF subfamily)